MYQINIIMNKKKLINELNNELSQEFPDIKLKIIKIIDKLYIIFEIFHNTNKSNKNINKFEIIDGGRKNRIIRKLKSLINFRNISYKNNKNIFVI